MPRLCIVSLLVLCTTVAAQTSPLGFDRKEGNSLFFHWGSNAAGRQLRGYDASQLRRPKVIRSLAFRRNGTSANAGVSRQLDVVLTVAETGMSVINAVLTRGLPGGKVVFSKKKVSFPDWTQRTPSPPAKFDFVLPFSAPFIYRGLQPLAWDVVYTNPTVSGTAVMDLDRGSARTATGLVLGRACPPFGHVMRLENNGANAKNFGMRLRVFGTGAPPNALGWLFLDFKDSNLTLPGFCTKIHAFPTLQIPLKANARGVFEMHYISLPYIKAAEGVLFVTQLVAVDTSQRPVPLIISIARRARMPASTSTLSHDAAFSWSPGGGQSGIGQPHFWGGIPITQIK